VENQRRKASRSRQTLKEVKEEMKAMEKVLQTKLKRKRARYHELQATNSELEKTVRDLYARTYEGDGLAVQLEAECLQLRRELECSGGRQIAMERVNIALNEEIERSGVLQRKLQLAVEDVAIARLTSERISELNKRLEATAADYRSSYELKKAEAEQNGQLLQGLKIAMAKLKLNYAMLNDRVCALHGNVRVFCRVRTVSSTQSAVMKARVLESRSGKQSSPLSRLPSDRRPNNKDDDNNGGMDAPMIMSRSRIGRMAPASPTENKSSNDPGKPMMGFISPIRGGKKNKNNNDRSMTIHWNDDDSERHDNDGHDYDNDIDYGVKSSNMNDSKMYVNNNANEGTNQQEPSSNSIDGSGTDGISYPSESNNQLLSFSGVDYAFDRVFPPSDTQDDVYQEVSEVMR
jgi:hypothetical protein